MIVTGVWPGRVRVISRSSGDRTLLQLPQLFPTSVAVSDMSVHGNRLAGITSDGGFVVWELPELIRDDVPCVAHFKTHEPRFDLAMILVARLYFVSSHLQILTRCMPSSGIPRTRTLLPLLLSPTSTSSISLMLTTTSAASRFLSQSCTV